MFRQILAVILGILGGAGFSQFPEYATQYEQRVGGALDELVSIVQDFDQDASKAGLSRQAALDKYRNTGDAFLTERGQSLSDIISRYDFLRFHKEELQNSNAFTRFGILAQRRDEKIAKATLEDYQPALPLTGEGLAHAGLGFVVAWILGIITLTIVLIPFKRRAPRIRRRPAG